MEKRFNHREKEKEIYISWKDSGYFNPDNLPGRPKETFSMVLPPPNVTGTLHIGHAYENSLQDITIRYHRMKGDRTLWIPGTDHAAIATQAKVEKQIYEKRGKNRHDLGREKFLKEVEEFVEKSHDTIENQLRAMGASLDWSREAFTLDKKSGIAVQTAFKKMYDDGRI
jgi:valyl-tRNA synthetase